MTFLAKLIPLNPSYRFKLFTNISVHFFAVLTILFLVLPGVSGPQTAFFWLRVECQEGQDPPANYKPIQQVLQLHLAITTIFFLICTSSYIFFLFPQAKSSKRYSTLVPLLAPFITSLILISDLCVAHTLEIKEGVKDVWRVGVFWLGTVSFVFSIIWCILAELDGMYKRRDSAESDEPIVQREQERRLAEKAVHGVFSLWPWRREEKKRSRSKEGSGRERSKSHHSDSKKSHHRSKSRSGTV
uniref:Uncharacterized protein n=1 Tax=Kwoniella bestiolae CBS 10118 TaxID=1296100 RepID=A0A1B9FWU4_9TREE|nr:hypothetical protein I302_07593 [Kwoniella bestiolae CBS 10118]OCF23239.1 hypothetical protein I302_07593 [Kwoniella bestiolae CBS 10118]